MHRILNSVFAAVGVTASAAHLAGEPTALAVPADGDGVMTCSPWAGLYLEGPGVA
jgi:hypothetical protein